jgi:hypothetical protein
MHNARRFPAVHITLVLVTSAGRLDHWSRDRDWDVPVISCTKLIDRGDAVRLG